MSSQPAEAVLTPLRRLRRRVRLLLIARAVTVFIAAVLGVLLTAGLLDYVLRTPDWFRVLVLIAGVAAAVWMLRRRLIPALRFCPGLTELALRLERSAPHERRGLAAAVDFASVPNEHDPLERSLAAAAVRGAATRAEFDPREFAPARSLRLGGMALAGVLLVALVLTIAAPALVALGAQRLLTPWTGAAWPKRTLLADSTAVAVHPRGAALPLTAELRRSPRAPEDADVAVRYRLRGGADESVRRELLTYQRGAATAGQGALFERLVDTAGESIRYRFESGDDQTDWRTITLVPPPVITAASVTLEPPSYVREALGAEAAPPIEVDLGTGTDERALAPSVLAGSTATLRFTLNKPASLESITSLPLADILAAEDAGATLGAEGSVITARFALRRPLRMVLVARDEFELLSPDPAVFVFDVETDDPASVAIVEPAADLRVLATALIGVRAEASDDVALRSATLERQLWTPAAGTGPDGALEAAGDVVVIAEQSGEPLTRIELAARLDLAPLELAPGDQVRLTAFARDLAQDEPAASPTRTILIIDETQFVDAIRGELLDLRQDAIRLDEQQAQLEQTLAEDGATRAARRSQQGVGNRLDRVGERLEQLGERIEQNRLDDPALDALVEQAEEAAGAARARAAEASEVLDRAAARAPAQEPAELTEDEQQQVEDAQRGVRDELARLASLLDRGEDAWAVRNAIERLRTAQQSLREQAAALEGQTAGRAADQLDAAEREQVEQLARDQAELAERAADLERDLSERARDLRDRDPQAAAGLEAASERAEQNNLAERTQRASELAEENRLAQAGAQQEQVIESLEEMLEDLDNAEQSQEDRLRRALADLTDTIRALIVEQESLLGALAEADGGLPGGHADAVIVLNRNTLAAADDAATAGPEAAAAASALRRAASAQERAIGAARAKPPQIKAVQTQQQRSLELLREALDAAAQAQQRAEQRELERQRRELRQRYAEILQLQIALVRDIEAFVKPGEPGRRERLRLRRLAARQAAVGAALADILTETDGLGESSIIEFAHQRIDRAVERTAADLQEANAPAALAGGQRVERGIRDLIEALRDPERPEEDFRDPGNGGGGGGGGGGQQEEPLVLPLAELRLLRFIQQDLADRTSDLDRAGPIEEAAVAELAEEQRDLAEVGVRVIENVRTEQQGGQPEGF